MNYHSVDDQLLKSPKQCIRCGKTENLFGYLIRSITKKTAKLPPDWHTLSERGWGYHPDFSNWNTYSKKLATSNQYRSYICPKCWETAVLLEEEGKAKSMLDWQRKQQEKQEEETRQQAQQKRWEKTDEAQQILKAAVQTEQEKTIYDWFQKNLHRTMHYNYECREGGYYPSSGTFVVGPPGIDPKRNNIAWEFPGCRERLFIPLPTITHIEIIGNQMTIQQGYAYMGVTREEDINYPRSVTTEKEVVFWNTWTFAILTES